MRSLDQFQYHSLEHLTVRRLSGEFQAILNISRIGRVAVMYLGSQTEETLLCVREQSLARGANQSAVRRRWLSFCTVWSLVAFTVTEWADQLRHDNATAHSTAVAQAKHHITQVCQPSYSPYLAPRDFWLFPKLKPPLKVRRFVNATVTQYTSSVNGVSLPTD